jgi:hypothetical protein
VRAYLSGHSPYSLRRRCNASVSKRTRRAGFRSLLLHYHLLVRFGISAVVADSDENEKSRVYPSQCRARL